MITPRDDRHGISPETLLQLGGPGVVYVTPIRLGGVSGFALNLANGQRIAVTSSRAEALAAALENHLVVVAVHYGSCGSYGII